MKLDLAFDPPWMNAAGSLGFTPEVRGPVDLPRLGEFITNPISLERRTPAQARRCLPFPGGFLLHTGYPNPGLNQAIRRYRAKWARAALPIIVHFSDICSHNGPPGEDSGCDAYVDVDPLMPTWEEAIAALNRRGAKYIGVNASGGTSCAGPTAPSGYNHLQSVRATVNGTTRRMRVCTTCIKQGLVRKAA